MSSQPDIIVVGGGVAGSAVAYELARRSADVLLLDASLPGRATSASAGGLWPIGEAVGLGCGVIYHASHQTAPPGDNLPEPLPELFREFLVESNQLFPDLADQLRSITGIDIELEPGPGLLFLMMTRHQRAIVDKIARSLPADSQLEILAPDELPDLEPHLTTNLTGAALLPGEHQVNPMLLAEAYKRAAIALGATFRPNCRVAAFQRVGDRVIGVRVGDELIRGDRIVNAAGSWAGTLAATAQIDLPVFPVRGQVVLTETLPKVLYSCISTSECYLAQKAHGEVLIGSTTEHVGFDVSVTEQAISSLCRGAIRAVPMLRDVNVKRVWSGLRPGTPDELPILGEVAGVKGMVNATGGFRTGIVAAPLMARLVADYISGRRTEFPIEPFLHARFAGIPCRAGRADTE